MKHIRTELVGFSRYLPEQKVTNGDLSKLMDTSDEWISARTGIRERRFADSSISSSDLAIKAVEKLFQENNYQPEDFDFIIACTLSPDYYYPGIAPIIQHKLNFPTIPSLDIRQQCSAFAYSLKIADAMIQCGQYKRILVVFTDVQSKFLDFSTEGRNVSVLFSDGAACVVCEAVEGEDENDMPRADNKVSGIIDTILGADGVGVDLLVLEAPGSAQPRLLSQEVLEKKLWHPKMNGKLVFKHAVTRMSEVVDKLMQKHNLVPDDIACLIPHQANMRISESVRARMNLPPEKMFNNIEHYGNTTSATIPICISEALEIGKVKKGDLIVTVGFGAGFTWGGSLIRL